MLVKNLLRLFLITSICTISIGTCNKLSDPAFAQTDSLATQDSESSVVAEKPQYTGIVKKVDDIAEQITVRIETDDSNGSGVIIAKQGTTYYIATAKHVLEHQKEVKVITPKGISHQINQSTIVLSEAYDFAIFSFESDQEYQQATLGNYTVAANRDQVVFTSGFPDFQNSDVSQRIITGGKVRKQEETVFAVKEYESLKLISQEGQGLLYSNISYQGMSGGGVFDSEGKLVGINAASENELYSDESENYDQYSVGSSLGIPVSDILGFLLTQTKLKIEWLVLSNIPTEEISDDNWQNIENQLLTVEKPNNDSDLVAWMNYGNQLWRYERYDKAIEAFKKVLEINPNFDKAYYAMGLSLAFFSDSRIAEFEKKLRWKGVIIWLNKAITINSKPHFYWRYLAISYDQLEEYELAIDAYKEAISRKSEDFVLYHELGTTQREAEQYEASVLSFNQAIALNSQHFWPYINRGLNFWALDKYNEAIADFTKVININPQHFRGYLNRAIIYLLLDKNNEAIADFTQVIKIDPQYKDAYHYRGVNYFLKGLSDSELEKSQSDNFDKAFTDFTQVIKIDSQYKDAYHYRGLLLAYLTKYDEAITNFNQTIKIDPQYKDAYYHRGETYYTLEQYNDAINDFSQAIKIDYNDKKSLFFRGKSYSNLNEYNKAIADFTQVIKIDSQDKDAYYERGINHANLGKYEQAIYDFTQSIKIDSNYKEAYFFRGNNYSNLEKYNEAIADFTRAIKINSNYNYNKMLYLLRGANYVKLEKYEQAIYDFTQSIKIDSNYKEAYLSVALALLSLEKYDEAVVNYTQAIKIDPNYKEAYHSRGFTFLILENKTKAKEDLEKAASLAKQQNDIKGYEEIQELLKNL